MFDKVNPLIQHCFQFILAPLELGQLNEVKLHIFQLLPPIGLVLDKVARNVVFALESDKIENANKNNLIEPRVVLSTLQLPHIRARGVIQHALLKAGYMFNLHFDNESHAALVGGANVQDGILERLQPGRLIWVQ